MDYDLPDATSYWSKQTIVKESKTLTISKLIDFRCKITLYNYCDKVCYLWVFQEVLNIMQSCSVYLFYFQRQ